MAFPDRYMVISQSYGTATQDRDYFSSKTKAVSFASQVYKHDHPIIYNHVYVFDTMILARGSPKIIWSDGKRY